MEGAPVDNAVAPSLLVGAALGARLWACTAPILLPMMLHTE